MNDFIIMIYLCGMANVNLVILASGNGSNTENIIKYFDGHESIKVALVVTNNSKAGVIERVKKYNIPVSILDNVQVEKGEELSQLFSAYAVDFIVLAGFLRKVPQQLTNDFRNRIINVHPSLLPKFGGKGMYGINVHRAVLDQGEKESGITIHLVNEKYDEGKIIGQFKVKVNPAYTPEELQDVIHQLEKDNLPKTIESYIKSF
jgi:phosphoribosylglycinamide formyltransferase-1